VTAPLPNGSRLSCGASAGGRKRPALRTLPLKAGLASFKRLLDGAGYIRT